MPAGRPNGYNPERCAELIAEMAKGYSMTAAMAQMGFHRQTGYDWMAAYPEFSDAVKIGQGKRQLFLEKRLMDADAGPVVTSSMFALKNTGTGDWRDRVTNEVTGADGGAIVTRDETPLTDNDIARRIAFSLAKGVRAMKDDTDAET